MFMSKRKSLVIIMLSASMIASVLSGCAATSNKNAEGTQQVDGPFPITIMSSFNSNEPAKPDNPLIKKLEEKTNTKLDITWVTGSSYTEKLNVAIATSDLPMVVMSSGKDSVLVNAIKSDMFWELGPYLKDYPNLNKLDPAILNNSSIDGKIYGIYKKRQTARYGLFYRQDWLDKLGMKPPTTIDEYYEMLKAFTYNDPDGNGKQDTYGTASSSKFDGFYPLEIMYGAPNNWDVVNGKVTPSFLTKEYMDFLNFYQLAYKEKMINQDFASAPGTKSYDEFVKGRVGVVYNILENYTQPYFTTDLLKVQPNAKIGVVSQLKGPNGIIRLRSTPGFAGMYLVSKSKVKTEAELKKVLSFLDALTGQDMITMFNYGLEGVDYKVENEKKILNTDQSNKDVYPVLQLGMELLVTDNGTPIAAEVSKQLKDNAKYAVYDVATPLESATNNEKGNSLTKIIEDARTKYVMGIMDEAGFQAEVKRWQEQGGQKIIEEYTESYQKLQQKK